MARACESKIFARFHVRKTYSVAITVATRRESVFVLCQVYWCYTDQPYCIYLREGFIDTLLIGGVNSASMILVNWIYEISVLNGYALALLPQEQITKGDAAASVQEQNR